MSRYVDTTYCEDTMIWVELDEYPEAYYAINDEYDIKTLMCADEDNNGASLDHLSDSEKEDIASEIKFVFEAHLSKTEKD